jgi:hypothetical protein
MYIGLSPGFTPSARHSFCLALPLTFSRSVRLHLAYLDVLVRAIDGAIQVHISFQSYPNVPWIEQYPTRRHMLYVTNMATRGTSEFFRIDPDGSLPSIAAHKSGAPDLARFLVVGYSPRVTRPAVVASCSHHHGTATEVAPRSSCWTRLFCTSLRANLRSSSQSMHCILMGHVRTMTATPTTSSTSTYMYDVGEFHVVGSIPQPAGSGLWYSQMQNAALSALHKLTSTRTLAA